jgi:hypothetical protein
MTFNKQEIGEKYDLNDVRSILANQHLLYIGEIILKTEEEKKKSQGFWKINYINDIKLIKKSHGRIYIIAVNNIILKIGLSECKGGIKKTFGAYQGALGGSPSLRTRGIHLLINKELEEGKNVTIYTQFYDPIKYKTHGLWFDEEIDICISMKGVEDICREQYYAVHGKYPDWNFQENCKAFPQWVKIKHDEYSIQKDNRKKEKDNRKKEKDNKKMEENNIKC